MPLPITIPNTFANATATIPLSQLDNNFSTVAVAVNSIGNGAFSLANVQINGGTIANVTLDNVSVDIETLSNITITNLTVDGNATFTNAAVTANVATITTANTTDVTASNSAVISVNTSGNALRITQVGTGNALVVEDSTNPDSTPFVIDASGIVISGHTTTSTVPAPATGTPVSTYALQLNGSSQNASIASNSWSNTAGGGSAISFNKSRGTTSGDYTVSSSGDTLGFVQFTGSDGAAFIRAAQILAAVDGTPGTNDMPGRLVFSTTPSGSASPTERMRIGSTGAVAIGSTAAGGGGSGCTLRFANNITGSTTSVSVYGTPQVQSDVTSAAYVFFSNPSTQATSFTLGTLSHFRAVQGTLGAGSTVTNQYGYEASNSLTGATNNYGFYSNIAAAAGRWNFYANGTADNYFAGNVGIGTSSPGQKLAVSGAGATNAQIYNTTLDAGMNIGVDTVGGNIATTAAVPIKFAPNGVERARIDSSGNLLVGTTTGLGQIASVSNASKFQYAAHNTDTSGAGQISFRFMRNNADVGSIQTTSSATSYVTSSDYRLKENIAPMTGALAAVAALKPVTYKWKLDGSDGQGFIAHELAEVCPDAVTGEKDAVNEDGSIKPQGIDTSFLVATLTAAIQELKAELDATKAKVAALENA